MICALCRESVADLPQVPESQVLCLGHLRVLYRERARRICSRPDCSRKLLLGADRECAWCALGQPVSVNVTTDLVPVTILRGTAYLAARDARVNDGDSDPVQNPFGPPEDLEDEDDGVSGPE